MTTVDIGVTVFMREGKEKVTLWMRSFTERLTGALVEKGIKQEFEVYGVGGIVEVNYLIEKMPTLLKPYWFDFVMGMRRINRSYMTASPRLLMQLVDRLPPDSMFCVMGVGSDEVPMTTQSILLGGHVRVGFEDNVYYAKGELAQSNAQLVARAARMGRELGCEIASPSEARKMLNIPQLG